MVSSTYLACHVQWKNEKVVINLSHVTRTFSPLYFFFHFSCISIIISIINFFRFSRNTFHIYLVPCYHHLKKSLYRSWWATELVMLTVITASLNDQHVIFPLKPLFLQVWGEWVHSRAWFFSHCSMLHLIITSVNRLLSLGRLTLLCYRVSVRAGRV